MSTVATSVRPLGTRTTDVSSTGLIWVAATNTSTGVTKLYSSSDGTTWANSTSPNHSVLNTASVPTEGQHRSSMWIDDRDYLHFVVLERFGYKVMILDATDPDSPILTSWSESTGIPMNSVDIAAYSLGTGTTWAAIVTGSYDPDLFEDKVSVRVYSLNESTWARTEYSAATPYSVAAETVDRVQVSAAGSASSPKNIAATGYLARALWYGAGTWPGAGNRVLRRAEKVWDSPGWTIDTSGFTSQADLGVVGTTGAWAHTYHPDLPHPSISPTGDGAWVVVSAPPSPQNSVVWFEDYFAATRFRTPPTLGSTITHLSIARVIGGIMMFAVDGGENPASIWTCLFDTEALTFGSWVEQATNVLTGAGANDISVWPYQNGTRLGYTYTNTSGHTVYAEVTGLPEMGARVGVAGGLFATVTDDEAVLIGVTLATESARL